METLQVSQCMSSKFVSLTADMPVFEAVTELVKNEILGAPVISEGKLIGWVSEQDCLKVVLQVVYFDNRVATVKDIMQTDVLTVKPEDSALDLCSAMVDRKPKNYPVVDTDGAVLGLVSRRMMLRRLCKV